MKKISGFFLLLLLISSGCNEVENLKSNKKKNIIKMVDQEVKDFITDQYDFLSVGSIDIAEKIFSKDATIFGTDEEEYLIGWEEIKPAILGKIEAIENPKFVTRNLRVVVGDNGQMASYSQILNFSYRTPTTESSSGVKYEIDDIRNSGVIKKIDGNWKIVQIHWSKGVKGQAIEYEFQK